MTTVRTQTIPNDGLWHAVGALDEHASGVEAPVLGDTVQLDIDWDGQSLVRNTGPAPVEVHYVSVKGELL